MRQLQNNLVLENFEDLENYFLMTAYTSTYYKSQNKGHLGQPQICGFNSNLENWGRNTKKGFEWEVNLIFNSRGFFDESFWRFNKNEIRKNILKINKSRENSAKQKYTEFSSIAETLNKNS